MAERIGARNGTGGAVLREIMRLGTHFWARRVWVDFRKPSTHAWRRPEWAAQLRGAMQSAFSEEFEKQGVTLVSVFVPPSVVGATARVSSVAIAYLLSTARAARSKGSNWLSSGCSRFIPPRSSRRPGSPTSS